MLRNGINLGFPLSRPMPVVNVGVYELRLKAATGVYGVFYYTKSEEGILIIHAFTKKSQKTPIAEIRIAQKRLKEMLCS
jgi:phage-related protein